MPTTGRLAYARWAPLHGADGVNFALSAPHATAVELCLFDATGPHEQQRLQLPAAPTASGTAACRARGPAWSTAGASTVPGRPHEGHALQSGQAAARPLRARDRRPATAATTCSSATTARIPSSATRATTRPSRSRRGSPRRCRRRRRGAPAASQPAERVLYELHVRGQTQLHPGVPADLRGTYAGLAEPAVLDHLQRLGVTTLSLLPVQHRADEERLLEAGPDATTGATAPSAGSRPKPRYWSGRARHHARERVPRHGRRRARARHGTGDRRGLQPQRRDRRTRPDAEPARHRQRALLPPAPGRPGALRELDRLRQQPGPGRAARAAAGAWTACATGSRELGVDGFRFDLAPVLARARRRRVRSPRALLRGHRAGPGAGAAAADRRALGHRPGRLPARRVPARLAGMERPLPRHAARLLAARAARASASSRSASRLERRLPATTAARRPPASTSSPRTTASRCATCSATTSATTWPTARTTATATATT